MTIEIRLQVTEEIKHRMERIKQAMELKDDGMLIARAIAYYELAVQVEMEGGKIFHTDAAGAPREIKIR